MVHPKVQMFLRERDRAYERNDHGVIRSMNVELRRLGVSDDATLADPAGKHKRNGNGKPKARAKPLKCEHENVAERCEVCNPELAAK